MNVKYEKAKEILENYHQEQVLKFFEELTESEKENLLNQILKIDFEQILELYHQAQQQPELQNDKIEPISYVDKQKLTKEEKEKYEKIGREKIKSGKLAVATMAGGQGTRLGHKGPKGSFYLFPNKSIFEIICDTLKQAKKEYGITLNWYIMTSKENHKETIQFFEENQYFDYPKEKITFFTQGELPMISHEGKIILSSKSTIKEAADGNGGIFESMRKAGIIEELQKNGVEWLFIGSVDNVLLKMVDPLLIGLTETQQHLAASKTVAKKNPKEKVGVFCKMNSTPSVIEYSELPQDMAELRDKKGELYYGESHVMCNMFHIEMLKQISKTKLPYHVATKKAEYLDSEGKTIVPTEPNCYKFESFIFDAFKSIEEMTILRVKREEEFAPVKNAEGPDSPETARELYKNFYHIK